MPVHTNRSIETMATLYDAVGNKVMSFRARKYKFVAEQKNVWKGFETDNLFDVVIAYFVRLARTP